MTRRMIHAFAAALCLLLAGCSTDGLTPQEEIPNASNSSATRQVEETPVRTVQTSREEQLPLIDSEPVETMARAPQNTLEAQATALEQGLENPSMTKSRDGNLGANLYKTDSQQQKVASIYSAKTATGTIRFLPIIGAPVQAITPLSKELGASARGNGLTIKGSDDQTAEYVLKGYLSAFDDGGKTKVVYVWDVLDNSGARLHRIQGQQTVDGGGSDAWARVTEDTMRQIGVETIAEYMKWRQTQS